MIRSISKLAKINSLLNEIKITKFNSLLPIKIDVLNKLESGKYQLLVGSKPLETKSDMKLDVGESYWGVMKDDPHLGIILSRLLKQPKLLKNMPYLPKLNYEDFEAILNSPNLKKNYKLFLLDHLQKASSRSEFLTTVSMIEALNNGVFTFILPYYGQENIFQFKKSPSSKKNQKRNDLEKIDFYVAFSNLGPIQGEIEVKNDIRTLKLYVYYESSLELLKNNKKELDMKIFLYKKDKILPFFEAVPSLLDIRG